MRKMCNTYLCKLDIEFVPRFKIEGRPWRGELVDCSLPVQYYVCGRKISAVAALTPRKTKRKKKKNMNEAKKLTSTRRSVTTEPPPPLGCYENPV
jgi:hypothetical protein